MTSISNEERFECVETSLKYSQPLRKNYVYELSFGDEIDRIREVNYLTGEVLKEREHFAIFPASHFVTREEKMKVAIERIEKNWKND